MDASDEEVLEDGNGVGSDCEDGVALLLGEVELFEQAVSVNRTNAMMSANIFVFMN